LLADKQGVQALPYCGRGRPKGSTSKARGGRRAPTPVKRSLRIKNAADSATKKRQLQTSSEEDDSENEDSDIEEEELEEESEDE
jgi:hypothetical protein